eukprot:4239501-Amphidinium_carterae.2
MIYKWIRGTAAVWDLAILHAKCLVLGPNRAGRANRLEYTHWQPGIVTFGSLGRARGRRGVDRWSIGELRLLPQLALESSENSQGDRLLGCCPKPISEMLYLQLPKEGAKDAGE